MNDSKEITGGRAAIKALCVGVIIGLMIIIVIVIASWTILDIQDADKEIEPGHYISWVTQKVEAVGHEYSLYIFVMYNGDVVSVDQVAFNKVEVGQHVHYYEGDIIDVDVVSAGFN